MTIIRQKLSEIQYFKYDISYMVMSILGTCQKWSLDEICGSQNQEDIWLVNLKEFQLRPDRAEGVMRVNLV